MDHPIFDTYRNGRLIYTKYSELVDLLKTEIVSANVTYRETYRYIENFADYEVMYKVSKQPDKIIREYKEKDELKTKEMKWEQLPFEILYNIYLKVGE